MQLFVPNIQPGEAPALRPFLLRNEAGTRSLALAVNQASYIAFHEYPGFEAFRDEGWPILVRVLERMHVRTLTRVGYSYENEIGLPDQEGFDVGSLFPGVIAREAPRRVMAPFHSSMHWILSGDQVGFQAQIDPAGSTLRVTVSSMARGDLDVGSLKGTLERVHRQAVELFEKLISDEFRKLISEEA